jgi:hypothetical protein
LHQPGRPHTPYVIDSSALIATLRRVREADGFLRIIVTVC